MKKSCTPSDAGTQHSGSANTKWLPCHTSSGKLLFLQPVWVLFVFTFIVIFFNTYFSSWMALSSEAPQPFSDPSLPCCRIPGAPAHIYQWKRKPFASLCPSGLALRIMGQWQAQARSRQTLFQCEHVGLDELICELGSSSKSHKTNKTPNNRGCCSRSPTFLLKPWLL